MAQQPDPWPSFIRRFKALEQLVQRLLNASPFAGTGMSIPSAGVVQLDGSLVVLGDFTAQGKINNDALTNPVVPAVAHGEGVNFTLSPTPADRATVTVPVPAGYTRAMVTATASLSAYNPTASGDYVYVAAHIQSDTTLGYAMPQGVGPSDSATTSQTATALLTGLSGSFTVKASASTGFVSFSTSTSGNVCNIDATVFFLR